MKKENNKKNESFKCVGVDVSKDNLDVCFLKEDSFKTYANTNTGIKDLTKELKKYSPDLVIFEPTGNYELSLLISLSEAKLPAVMKNARQIRDYAKALGLLAKTDKIDSKVLAMYGESVRPEIRPFSQEKVSYLHQLVTRRSQLVSNRAVEKNRYSASLGKIKKEINTHIKWLDKRINDIDNNIQKEIDSNSGWNEKLNILKSASGIGPISAAILIVQLPELGKLNKKEIAALVGLAPFNRDSGHMRGKRTIFGGRKDVRCALYMATMSARIHNPPIKAMYNRLTEKGKCHKLAMTACMRKFIIILNTMMKNKEMWEKRFV